jgi:hypothetical protein
MSDFFKQLNGQYAVYYRKRHGGRGYVFQDRFRSMLIQDDAYLMIAIAYVLGNPVAAKIAANFIEYPWSSANLYFGQDQCDAFDCGYVEELFGSRDEMHRFILIRTTMNSVKLSAARSSSQRLWIWRIGDPEERALNGDGFVMEISNPWRRFFRNLKKNTV